MADFAMTLAGLCAAITVAFVLACMDSRIGFSEGFRLLFGADIQGPTTDETTK